MMITLIWWSAYLLSLILTMSSQVKTDKGGMMMIVFVLFFFLVLDDSHAAMSLFNVPVFPVMCPRSHDMYVMYT